MLEKSKFTEEEAFRDSVSTIDAQGKRQWIYPKKPKGILYTYRTYLSYLLLLILFSMPFIKVNGEQFMLFNILERKFNIFGITFMPQDFYLFGLTMVVGVLFIVLFTVVFGRLFCGWICPQTIFMEMVFRKIEYWIEGDYTQQKRLNKAPWDAVKTRKKITKHIIFFAIAFIIGNIFLAYIIGSDELIKIIKDPVHEHLGGFIAMIVFSFVFYGVFAFFREQVCLVACPYGRLQGVMLDKNSIVVAYDHVRGEPRGKIRKKRKSANGQVQNLVKEEPQLGDCINCSLCVKVCPTGIDIRNGTQLECINCTACIDACDEVMEKVNRPKGLIRYASHNNIEKREKFKFTSRIIAYMGILTFLVITLGFLILNRSNYDATILRTRGMLYQKVDENTYSNLYDFHIVNKTKNEGNIRLEITEPEGTKIRMVGDEKIFLNELGDAKAKLFIDMPVSKLQGHKTPVKIDVFVGDELVDEIKTNFIGPIGM